MCILSDTLAEPMIKYDYQYSFLDGYQHLVLDVVHSRLPCSIELDDKVNSLSSISIVCPVSWLASD